MGHGDLCAAHQVLWRRYRDEGGTRAGFLQAARPFGPGNGIEEHPCRICPGLPASHLTLRLCHHHQFRWYNYRDQHGDAAGFGQWLACQEAAAGYGRCRVRVCPETAFSPLGLCSRHDARYQRDGRPGDAVLPSQWANRYERTGQAVPVEHADEPAFRRWCATTAAVPRPDQVNLRGLHPLLRAEIQWGMCWHTRRQHWKWELSPIQRLADYGRDCGLRSLTDLAPGDPGLRKAAGREGALIASAIAGGLHSLYVTPAGTREAGYILTEHFGRKLSDRGSRIDLDRISQRWLRDLVLGPLRRCPAVTVLPALRQHLRPHPARRPGTERLPGGLRSRRRSRPPGPHGRAHAQVRRRPAAARARRADLAGSQGRPRQAVDRDRQYQAGRLPPHPAAPARGAGVRRGLPLGLDRGFITAMPAAGRVIQRSRPPFTDGVARALADEANLQALARDHDPLDRGLRDAWETIIVTGRRCSEVLEVRLDCRRRALEAGRGFRVRGPPQLRDATGCRKSSVSPPTPTSRGKREPRCSPPGHPSSLRPPTGCWQRATPAPSSWTGLPPSRRDVTCCRPRSVRPSRPTMAGSTFPASPPSCCTPSSGWARWSPTSCRPRIASRRRRSAGWMSLRRELPTTLARSLSKALCTEHTVVPPAENLLPAIGHAHRLMDSAAVSRRAVLAAEVSGGFEAERGRAGAYYADTIARIERRLAVATPDRAAVLRERLRATREEQARRLAEIAEKYEARHVIRPYRLHVLLVPALRVAADVLRGSRRYPMSFDWLLPAGCTRRCAARRVRPRPRWWPARRSSAARRACPRSRRPRQLLSRPRGNLRRPSGSPRPSSRPRPPSLPWRNRPLHSRQQRGNPASVGLSRPRCAGRSRRPDPR